MKAVTIRMDDGGLDALLERVRQAQELGFEQFDLRITNPQAPLGRIVSALKEHSVSLCGLRLLEPKHSALVTRTPGYAKIGALDEPISVRSAEMVAETALQMAPANPGHLILDGGFVNQAGLREKQGRLDELLDCEDCTETLHSGVKELVQIDSANAEIQLEHLARGLHSICKKVEPLHVCLLPPASPFGLLMPERMEQILDDLKQQRLGYWHSTSNAGMLQRMGVADDQAWIARFGARLRGVYLADTLGAHGEQAPGLGSIDFQKIAPELSQTTIRVLVVDDATGNKLRYGTEYLAKVGIF